MSPSTFALALAVFVAFAVAASSLILAVRCSLRTSALSREWSTSKPAKLAATVEDLADELAAHKRSMRRELGSMWQKLGPVPRQGPPADDLPQLNGELDPELAAELALQHAPATAPGRP